MKATSLDLELRDISSDTLSIPTQEQKTEFKCSYLSSPIEDTLSKTLGTIFALIMLTDEPFLSIAIPVLISPFVFWTNYQMYSKTASLGKGVDILDIPAPAAEITSSSSLLTNPKPSFLACSLKDLGMWLSSAEKGIMYGYSVYSVILKNSSPMLRITGGVYAGLISHRADLLGEMRVWSLRREAEGEPGYERTVGKILDFTDSFIPIPLLPERIRNKIRIDPFVTQFYPDYRAFLHILAGQYVLQNLLGFSAMPALLIAWLLPLGGPEQRYVASYSQKVMQHALKKVHKDTAEGFTWLLVSTYNFLNEVMNFMNGRLTAALLGILIAPVALYQFGKMAGSALIGTAAGAELREQVPELTKILVRKFSSNKDFDFEIPDWFYYSFMLAGMTLVLFYIGHVQVKAADSRLLAGEQIGFPEQTLREYDIEPSNPPVMTTYCEGVQHRASGLAHQIKEGFKTFASSLSSCFFCCKSRPASNSKDEFVQIRIVNK